MCIRDSAVVAVTLTLASMFIIPCVARVFVGYDAELLALTSRAFRLYALSFVIMGFNVYALSLIHIWPVQITLETVLR